MSISGLSAPFHTLGPAASENGTKNPVRPSVCNGCDIDLSIEQTLFIVACASVQICLDSDRKLVIILILDKQTDRWDC